jgi:Protein of unknown function (DUF1573)
MKKLLIVAITIFTTATAFGQAPVVAATTAAKNNEISFSDVKHSFGKIKQNIPASYTFNLKNNGSKPLIIEQATAQCGCTTPEYSKSPILKGKSSPIKVTYNAANPGPFTKTVTVKFLNVPEPTILTIEGEVLKGAETAPKKG